MATKRVVVVCGWMGAKARPVTKYADLYRKLGYDAVVLLSSQGDFLTDGANVHPTATDDLLPPAESLELIPHMLSNGGCRSWYCFEDHLRASQRAFRVPAMVFDSAPSRATTEALLETWKGAGNLPSLGLSLGMRAFLVQLTLYPYVTRTANVFGLHWQRYFVEQAHIPKLFLYSSADEIVSAECVQAAIEDATAHGSDVASVNFGQSPHVSHLATDPVGYAQHLQAFLDKHVR